MVRIQDCDACQIGDHKNHNHTVQAVPKGVLGGVVCVCKGECVKDADERREKFLSRIGLTRSVREALKRYTKAAN